MAYTLHIKVVEAVLSSDKNYSNLYCTVCNNNYLFMSPIFEKKERYNYAKWNHKFHFIKNNYKNGEIKIYVGSRTKLEDKDLAFVTIDYSTLILGKVIDQTFRLEPCSSELRDKVNGGNIKLVIHIAPFEATPFIESKNAKNLERIEKLQKGNKKLKKNIKEMEKEINQLEGKKSELSSRQSLLDSGYKLQAYNEELQMSNGQLLSNKEQLINYNTELRSTNQNLINVRQQLQSEFEQLKETFSNLKNQIDSLEEEKMELTKAAREVNPELSERLEELEENNQKLKTQNKRIQGKVDFLRDENKQLMNSVQSFVSIAAKAKGDFSFKDEE